MKTYIAAPTNPSVTPLEAKNRLLAREAAIEGMVLLKNDGVLPLKEKSIALYGAGARMTVKGGRGSGEVRNRNNVSIEEGLEKEGFTILTKNWLDGFDRYFADLYETYRQDAEKKVEGVRDFHQILHLVPNFVYPTGMRVAKDDLVTADTAIYVLSRQAGEAEDRSLEKADYYLSDVEEENLRFLRKHYKNLVLIINVGGFVDLSILESVPVNALVYFVQGGEEGGAALASLLSGASNFSGKLTSTWPRRIEDVPSHPVFSDQSDDPHQQDYVEGIFIGYRYFDRFGIEPLFPFGYGLSYTTFRSSLVTIRPEKNTIHLSVEVTNTGAFSGKEVALIYAMLPDEKSEIKRLVSFGKTGALKPGETELLELSVSVRDLAIYEEEKAAWIVRGGFYPICIGSLEVARLSLEKDFCLEQCKNIAPVLRDFKRLEIPEKPALSSFAGSILPIDACMPETVIYDYAPAEDPIDPLIKELDDRELAMLVIGGTTSPKNPQVAAFGASGSTTTDLYDSHGIPNISIADGPAGLNLTRYIVQLPDGTVKAARVPENMEDYKRYLFGFAKIMLGYQMAEPESGIMHYQFATAWPAGELLAQTFNETLLTRIGDGVGKEMEAYGASVINAPGMNIHRNPRCGRTFEYYSEDPFVAGKTAAAFTKGVQSHADKGVSLKHFVCNNCEFNRNLSSSNLDEKALREIYLRGFEIAVRESKPQTVMASYNLVNGLHVVNHKELLTDVLRSEWGYKGTVISDWDSMKANPKEPCIPLSGDVQKAHAAGCDLVCPGRPDQIEALVTGLSDGTVKRADLEKCGNRVLRLIRECAVIPSK